MSRDQLGGRMSSGDTSDPLGTERDHLRRQVRQAFGLAKAGASCCGYRLLYRGRERVLANIFADDPYAMDLLRQWDAAVRWFERYAPSPL